LANVAGSADASLSGHGPASADGGGAGGLCEDEPPHPTHAASAIDAKGRRCLLPVATTDRVEVFTPGTIGHAILQKKPMPVALHSSRSGRARAFLSLLAFAPLSLSLTVPSSGCASSAPPPVVALSPAPSPSAPPPTPPAWPYKVPVVVHGSRGMVVTDNAVASKVGRDVLAAGGNAADAAVAAAFALAVAYPTAGNLGGGGFAVARIHGESRALDFRETAPSAAARDMYVDATGKSTVDAREGIKSAGVPGSVAGLWELHRTLGSKKISWAQALEPAIKLAEQGVTVDEAFLDPLEHAGSRLKKYPASAALFYPGGQLPAKGAAWKNPELAAVLRRIVEQGPRGFYEGPTAAAIVEEARADGGLITQADLSAYKAKWRTPLELTYRGRHITAMPPPSSGGVTLAMICHILEGYDLGKLGWQSPLELHYVFEAMRRSFAARNAKLGDPDFVTMPLDELLGGSWATQQRATIKPDRATPSSEIASAGVPSGAGPNTTHMSIVDGEGNAVALTTTLNWWFGSGVTVKGAGFVLNNEMDDFAAVPGTANGFGLVQGEANAIAPGKRMLSSMAPTIVTGPDGQVVLVAGAAGGPTIITSVFEELSNVVDFGLDIGTAVSAPRFHMQHLPDVVAFEKDGILPETANQLEAMGYTLKERGHLADAPALARSGSEWIGAAEPRRVGALAATP
jgi:gamma-glutamyltranspeptidase/glutathione hydrolase